MVVFYSLCVTMIRGIYKLFGFNFGIQSYDNYRIGFIHSRSALSVLKSIKLNEIKTKFFFENFYDVQILTEYSLNYFDDRDIILKHFPIELDADKATVSTLAQNNSLKMTVKAVLIKSV